MRVKTAPILERDILKLITDYCDAKGIFWRRRTIAGAKRLPSGQWAILNRKGESDLWGIHRGIHWECEVKKPGEKPTDIQTGWLNLCVSHGAKAFWTDSLERFIKEMNELGSSLESYWDKH